MLIGLEKFKRVQFDFNKIKNIGQGFADQVFRVFQEQHPDIKLTYINTNPDIEFMRQRAIKLMP